MDFGRGDSIDDPFTPLIGNKEAVPHKRTHGPESYQSQRPHPHGSDFIEKPIDIKSIEYSWSVATREFVFGSKLNILAVAIPFALFGRSMGLSDGIVFTLAIVGLIPMAERVSWVTEQLASHTNKTIGGLLNATFGNVTELFVCVFAIHDGLYRVVQLSMLGSILSNLLLVLGSAFFVGGIRFKSQKFNKAAGNLNGGLLMIASLACLLPAVLHLTNEGDTSGQELMVSRFSAVVLLALYGALLFFELVSHADWFDDEEEEDEESQGTKKSDDNDEDEVVMSFWMAIVALVFVTFFISYLSDIVTETIKPGAEAIGLSTVFISAVIIPIAGNAAEHAAAIVFAYRDEMDIAIGVAVGSAAQISMLALPFCVVYAWIFDKPLSLYLEGFETAALIGSVFTTLILIGEGKSHYLIGLLLIGAYLIVCAGFLEHRSEDLS